MSGKTTIVDALAADAEGASAPPRSNGELVFEAPWEGRAFGVAVALSERETFEWERFRQELIAEIEAWEREHGTRSEAGWSYYERWLASLERLLVSDCVLAPAEIEARVAELVEHDAHEHDHEHEHGHDHHH